MSKNTPKLQKCNCFTLIFLRYLQVLNPLLVVLVDMYQFVHCALGLLLFAVFARTYVCNVCAYTHTRFAAAKVHKKSHICKYIWENLSKMLILQRKSTIIRYNDG